MNEVEERGYSPVVMYLSTTYQRAVESGMGRPPPPGLKLLVG